MHKISTRVVWVNDKQPWILRGCNDVKKSPVPCTLLPLSGRIIILLENAVFFLGSQRMFQNLKENKDIGVGKDGKFN